MIGAGRWLLRVTAAVTLGCLPAIGAAAASTSPQPPAAAASASPSGTAIPSSTASPGVTAGTSPPAVPLLAYYYIWFDTTSWNRAKIDTPLLGKYTSDDRTVMRRHVQMAKAAGINGFLVSWKDTPVLSERLGRLVQIAGEQQFKLGIVYEGLTFARKPLPADQIERDLLHFADVYATNPVFDIFGSKPPPARC